MPINLFAEKTVFSGLVTACLFAVVPTYLSFDLGLIPTTDGVVRFPSAFSKFIGLILCGIVEEPISPLIFF